jgi:hypothetical protein
VKVVTIFVVALGLCITLTVRNVKRKTQENIIMDDYYYYYQNLYVCDDCTKEVPLDEMHGGHQHLVCHDCWKGETDES